MGHQAKGEKQGWTEQRFEKLRSRMEIIQLNEMSKPNEITEILKERSVLSPKNASDIRLGAEKSYQSGVCTCSPSCVALRSNFKILKRKDDEAIRCFRMALK